MGFGAKRWKLFCASVPIFGGLSGGFLAWLVGGGTTLPGVLRKSLIHTHARGGACAQKGPPPKGPRHSRWARQVTCHLVRAVGNLGHSAGAARLWNPLAPAGPSVPLLAGVRCPPQHEPCPLAVCSRCMLQGKTQGEFQFWKSTG